MGVFLSVIAFFASLLTTTKVSPGGADTTFCDLTYGESHDAYDDKGKWRPKGPTGEKVEQAHSDSACDGSGFLSK